MKKMLFLGLCLAHFQAWALSPALPTIQGIKPAQTLCTMSGGLHAKHGLAQHKNHFLLLDKQGYWHILGQVHPEKQAYVCGGIMVSVLQNEQWHVYDGETGQKLSENLSPIEEVSHNVATGKGFIELKQQGKWAIWRRQNGKLVQITPREYDGFYAGNTGGEHQIYPYDFKNDDIRYFQAALNNKWGVIDAKGNWILPAQYQQEQIMLYHNVMVIYGQAGVYDVLDYSAKKITQINSKQFEAFFYPEIQGIVLKDQKTKKYGFMNLQGQWVLPVKYDLIGEPSFNRALILKDKREGFINEKGEIVIPMVFDFVENSNISTEGFWANGELRIAPKHIGQYCSLYVATDGALIDNDFFTCTPNANQTHPEDFQAWEQAEKQKAIALLKSRGYDVKWRTLPEIPAAVPASKPEFVRQPLPDLPDVAAGSEIAVQTTANLTPSPPPHPSIELTWWEKIKRFVVDWLIGA